MVCFRLFSHFLFILGLFALTGCSLGEGGTETSVRTPTSGNSNPGSNLGSDSSDSSNPSLGSDDSSSSSSSSSSSDSNSSSGVSAFEDKAFDLVNEYRVSKGLSPLVWSSEIASVARGHSANMADGSVPFSHEGFDSRGTTLQATVGWSAIAENVAFNNGYADPATVAVNGWINSSGHEANMSGNFTKTGMGVAISSDGSYYFTQIFIR